ncbi:ABC transporter substrate-binding protein [Salinibacterium sp. NK8237]|uniref:ABC transporter substrate-binding protein n=1 Tax=Salinibacterium sp. NK8237 TaxID=2792038 RepID=UPI0018CF52B6|nr:ABC transporter substrate-binding protein [Salinibacterium sp. NK8237]MBH0130095.1 ABC transporter substrate-binding protein [Salinibacterium sp. NK8237]
MRHIAAGAAALLAVSALGGCASAATEDSSTTAASGDSCEASLTIGYLPVGSAASVVLGIDQGFFADEGLDITLVETPAASLQASVVSGESQFAFTSAPAVIATSSNGLPVVVVGAAAGLPAAGTPSNISVVTGSDTGIVDPEDLVGKTIAVDSLYQLPHISLLQSLEFLGIDPSTVTVSEVAYSAMLEAIDRGQVDAAAVSDGFLLSALDSGYTEVLPTNTAAGDGGVAAVWIASQEYASANPDVVGCFQRALAESSVFAAENDDAVRAILPTYTSLTAEVAADIRLPDYTVTLDPAAFEAYEEIMLANDVIENTVDLDTLLLTQ